MKEKIQPYEITGKGIATEALVEIQSRFTTEDKAVIYYDLRDTTQTSTARRLSNGEILTLPYKILSYQKITVTGNDRASIEADATFASNIVFRDRTDIVKDTADTNTYKYFAVRNKMSMRGGNTGRTLIDGNGYELYEKQSASRKGLSNYTLLKFYVGDPAGEPIFDGKGNLVGYDGRQLTYNYGAGIIDVNVTTSSTGQIAYTVAPNSRGDQFYINLIHSYL
jgi:hypothetical protein